MGALALAAAVGMVIRVHDGTANGGTPAHVALTTGLTDVDVGVVDVADLADAGLAVQLDQAVPHRWADGSGRSHPPWPSAEPARQRRGPAGRPCRDAARCSWMTVPTGMLARGRQLPGLMSAVARGLHLVADLQADRSRGYRPSRRPHTGGERCWRNGWDRTPGGGPQPRRPSGA